MDRRQVQRASLKWSRLADAAGSLLIVAALVAASRFSLFVVALPLGLIVAGMLSSHPRIIVERVAPSQLPRDLQHCQPLRLSSQAASEPQQDHRSNGTDEQHRRHRTGRGPLS